jgi:glycosyltransferase involved in cell wall biosynthesis
MFLKKKKIKVLFISHSAYRAGAQLLLLGFLRYLRRNRKDIEFDLLLATGGDLLVDFRDIANTYIWDQDAGSDNISFKGQFRKWFLLKKIGNKNYDLVYSNTIMNGAILDSLKLSKVPTITHVHEMDYWMDRAGSSNIEKVVEHTTSYIAVSEAVKKTIIKKMKVPEIKIDIIYGFVQSPLKIDRIASIRELLGLPQNCKVVGACGAEDYRKGKDLFIKIAQEYFETTFDYSTHFVWIGGSLDNESKQLYDTFLYKNNLHFISHTPKADKYFHEFDVFCMTSRDDPFPVVNLEVGIRKVPIICFNNSGGSSELLRNMPDQVIENWSIENFTKRIYILLYDQELHEKVGQDIHNEIINNYTIEIIAKKMISYISEIVINGRN